jgi:N-acetylmuramic acid 6-phosphate etherase
MIALIVPKNVAGQNTLLGFPVNRIADGARRSARVKEPRPCPGCRTLIVSPPAIQPHIFKIEHSCRVAFWCKFPGVNKTWAQRSDEFLKISSQFQLGALITETSHPVTARLSDTAKSDIAAALKLLFDVDADVLRKFREFVASGCAVKIKDVLLQSLEDGGRIFFTGCGSTGRLSILLDSIWRDFCQQCGNKELENRTFSVMAGGDYALIKSVEGFEDFSAFGKKQMQDLFVTSKDVVFAITEGGETSFVIGTAWAGVEAGAKVYFVYNNPDDVLCEHVERSHEVIKSPRIEKINLTTGPMAITGSTRMQATSMQLCALLTICEMVLHELAGQPWQGVPEKFLAQLEAACGGLKSPEFLESLARLVALEESLYRGNSKSSYFAGRFGIDVLTDTTERSPTYCTPPFRKFDDDNAAESWAFLFVPEDWTDKAWQELLKRKPRCVEWSQDDIRHLVPEEKFDRTRDTIEGISSTELMRYKIGSNGLRYRTLVVGDGAIAVMSAADKPAARQFQLKQLEAAAANNARTGVIYFGTERPAELESVAEVFVFVPVPASDLLLDSVTRVLVKLVMNALSTCTMVRLGRVMDNFMIWVVPSNLKLIDRATRYVAQLTGLNYPAANRLLFEVIEYVEPRMKSDQAYPPVVGMAVLRAKEKLTNEQAEQRLKAEM